MSEPRCRPIIFSMPMVKAILAGRKTQTRRIVKQFVGATAVEDVYHRPDGRFIGLHLPLGVGCGITEPFRCPHGARGDRLWVRESWRPLMDHLSECTGPQDIRFAASVSEAEWATSKWRPSIHMPRWASRLTLTITNVRIERLQAITPADAIAEGCAPVSLHSLDCDSVSPVVEFRELWDRINGPGSWQQNPWVWALTFERIK